jgi:deoxyribonuclease-4
MPIKFGPAGIGPVKEVEKTFEEYKSLGIYAAEIPFTYGVYIKSRDVAKRVKKASKKFEIQLSVHAPYWINLNSADKEIIEKSKQRILKCCEVGTWLGAKRVVFHPGYYGNKEKEESYENIKREILEIQKQIKKKKYTTKLAPETTGKINVFGSIDEIRKLVEEIGCDFCIDFAHILARYKTYNFDEIKKTFSKNKTWHCHFSGIEYREKGEKNHKKTPKKELRKLISNLPKNKNITIINESPSPVEDSVLGLRIYQKW